MKKLIIALVFTGGIITSSTFIMSLYTHHHESNNDKKNHQTLQNIEPCSVDEIIYFFNLMNNNATELNCTLLSKKTKNGMTKITWSYPQEGFGWNTDYTFYIPTTGNLFYSDKERYCGCDYLLYKNNFHNNNETIYLLVYNHSGSGNYGGVIGAWTSENGILIKKDCSCFYTDECPEHIADSFVVSRDGKIYLQFIAWEHNEPIIRHYAWNNNSLQVTL